MSLRRFIDRLRGRRRFPKGDGRMTANWKRGDLAGCSEPGRWYEMETGLENHGPNFGDIERVAEVTMDDGWQMLRFEAWPGQRFTAHSFRKIVPAQDEACSYGFERDLMKRLRPKVDA